MATIPQNIIKDIVRILNVRGFVVDSDVMSFCSYKLFDGIVISNINALRAYGYKGGDLISWTTAFKGPSPAYGVYDSEASIIKEDIMEYCWLMSDELYSVKLTIDLLERTRLGISFKCYECQHSAILPPKILKPYDPKKYSEVRGVCTKCGNKGVIPYGLQVAL